MIRRASAFPLAGLCCAMLAGVAGGAGSSPGFTLDPIGRVERADDRTIIVVKEAYQQALLRLDDFSHVWVIWWFDRNDTPAQRSILRVHPRRDRRNPLSGVFATRAPVRPNPIGLTLCRVLGVEGNLVEIDAIDAFNGTPVLDLKPYIPEWESRPGARVPERY